jgi:solute carrier family 25 protein 39/40
MQVPATTMYFSAYEKIKGRVQDAGIYAPLLAGGAARTITVFLTSPFDLFRTNLQSHNRNVGSLDILKTLVREGHVSRLWVGLKPTLARDVPFSAIYWSGYELTKKYLHVYTSKEGFLVNFTAGALAGSVAAVATVPFDVVKTTMQMNVDKTNVELQKGILPVMRRLVREEGLSALYKGVLPRAVKVAPACAIMISTYEFMKEFFALRQDVPFDSAIPPVE